MRNIHQRSIPGVRLAAAVAAVVVVGSLGAPSAMAARSLGSAAANGTLTSSTPSSAVLSLSMGSYGVAMNTVSGPVLPGDVSGPALPVTPPAAPPAAAPAPAPAPAPVPAPAPAPAPQPAPTVLRFTHAPKVVGDLKVGDRLQVRHVDVNADAAKVSYQWRRDGKNIKGADSKSLRLSHKDEGSRISVRITVRLPGSAPLVKVIKLHGSVH